MGFRVISAAIRYTNNRLYELNLFHFIVVTSIDLQLRLNNRLEGNSLPNLEVDPAAFGGTERGTKRSNIGKDQCMESAQCLAYWVQVS